ncbi:pseudouridylate synthase / pseudouridine kinase [Mytilus galloprovincialis]|uniref:Pseudouridylate synthase / pseudouridine kinase n=1 Tax=Mytilus galloprovincialis TaxID=29158 RepID=A0A8B6EIR6_MYTGA|nr:pseudouridylate synthase / pseudouridine kinase [Mytilus galloprovincialis]
MTMTGPLFSRLLSRFYGYKCLKQSPWKQKTCYFSNSVIQVQDEVKEALHSGKPVVALESTIITHGMPYPHNLSTAQSVESLVRNQGVIPATIAVINGKVKVGLTTEELELLSKKDKPCIKASRRDLSYIISQGMNGGTTVSGTMSIANQVGIPIFVTGGIGGVHREAETSMDISADLTELGRTPVTVISAGVKSILDIGRTLEYLETKGVCVASYGNSRDFPAFFVPRSGYQSPYNVQDATKAAELIVAQLSLGLQSGILIAVPIPQESSADGEIIEDTIQQALNEAKKQNIIGKEVTPFVLQRVNEMTQGSSLTASILYHLGSQIARKLSDIRSYKPVIISTSRHRPQSNDTGDSRIDLSGVTSLDKFNTATYCAVLSSNGELMFGIGDMDVHKQITPEYISGFEKNLALAPMVVLDGNISTDSIEYVCHVCHKNHVPVWYEPTDVNKAHKPFLTSAGQRLTYISPNLNELRVIYRHLTNTLDSQIGHKDADVVTLEGIIDEAIWLSKVIIEEVPVVLVTLGRHGVMLCQRSQHQKFPVKGYRLEHSDKMTADIFPAFNAGYPPENIVSVSGAGDCLAATMISGIVHGHDPDLCVKAGLMAAQMSLKSYQAVPPNISKKKINLDRVKIWAPWQPQRVKQL